MLLNLVRKDILIAKKYVFATMAIIVVIPLFFLFAAPDVLGSGFICFLYMVVLGEVVLLQAISQTEGKYPKAAALLCAAPYKRSSIVIAEYIFFLLIFAYCYIAHTLLMLMINPANLLDLTTILTVFLISAVMYGFYMPFEFKFGFIKAKYLFMIIIILFSVGPTLFRNLLAGIDFSALAAIPVYAKNIGLALLSIMILGASMIVSIKIFFRKEL